ncbi:phosphate regulon transcriptional regulator PhoB [Burkholderia cenocepacia]|jgi:two-component system, OmpR family, phosphate regulon response regulator PhoB|uniref:Phosphate regulon transcriptional regulatory protein PhoB n=1 Tax=Burkholderia cenocepacia TaxID=95486 RepID=A0ABD4UGA0_9BURK|nr:phosphate regulon transcriptional regulator PhoB [Burkholderia cenocepacia]MCW3696763.1 phosphate regulon transcriptional regulator PhoB [Burkholderia cenocepacia]MCW3704979.1 phosphate regulon transcriptional regulator PhoB [Burkholderia cenocepacia]MCW3713239.1 phosphate regulon transcriptional regulator PhoB [Burkholderia cenocepacia]MCW3721824.1 phosphate regulon transcriptional regulator PhoB [Burkholderia cenocepacia]MCW3729231.1 phosphate regulon transcriptional regulator PhoB [Burkh
MPINVMIVEDEPAVVDLLAVNLKHAGMHPLEARDASVARSLIAEVLPDLILLDWMLPGMSGLQFLRHLRADSRTRDVPVVMLTARDDERDRIDGLEAGADDYLAKPFSPKELVARIKAVLRRSSPQLTDDPVTVGKLTLDPGRHLVFAKEDGREVQVRLGPLEFKVLHFFMVHPERVHSRSTILDRVWGDHIFIEERTIDVHVKRLREALKPVGCDAIIETVRGSGYRLAQPAPNARFGVAA